MMELEHEAGAGQGVRPPVEAFFRAVGALISVALVAGVVWWGYNLAVRDVSGVPVVRALEGPMRVAPADPGGMQAAHQGLAVNAVASEGLFGTAADHVVLAPAPLDLDTPLPVQRVEDVAEAVLRRPEPIEGSPDVIPASIPGIARSPIPPARPADVDLVAETAARAVLMSLAPEASLDVDPAALAAGTRLVQLGAFDDAAEALAAWEDLAGRFGAHLEGRGRIIQPAEAAGRSFYRLRATGFVDDAEARRFCAVLLAEEATCIPVLVR
jgi:hypothetical protein